MHYHTQAFVKNNNTKICRFQPLVLVTQFQGVGLFVPYFILIQFISIVSIKKWSQGSLHVERI